MPIYIDKDDDITPYIVGIKLSNGTKYEFNYETLKNRPCFNDEDATETYLDETVIPGSSTGDAYLTFSSDAPFTLGIVEDGDWQGKGWDGSLEYSADLNTWTSLWDDYPYSAISSGADNKLYLRGTNNTTFASGFCTVFDITATDGVECSGNIETLLDYQTVINGRHPTMANRCFSYLFFNCNKLTHAPSLPAITLSEACYCGMFSRCTSLTEVPQLPATILAARCYASMFYDCTSIKLSETQTAEYTQPYRIPFEGTGVDVTGALTDMFAGTSGTFTGTPVINTTYYTYGLV